MKGGQKFKFFLVWNKKRGACERQVIFKRCKRETFHQRELNLAAGSIFRFLRGISRSSVSERMKNSGFRWQLKRHLS